MPFPLEMLFQGSGPAGSAIQHSRPRCVELVRCASFGPSTALPHFSRRLTSRIVAACSKEQHTASFSHRSASHELPQQRAVLASLLGRHSCRFQVLMHGPAACASTPIIVSSRLPYLGLALCRPPPGGQPCLCCRTGPTSNACSCSGYAVVDASSFPLQYTQMAGSGQQVDFPVHVHVPCSGTGLPRSSSKAVG